MKLYLNIIFFSLVSLFASCEKVITITPPPYQDKVSIQCMLELDSLPIVYFNKTVPYFDPKISFADLVIRKAIVKISDGVNVDNLLLDSVYDKIYCQFNYYYKGSKLINSNKNYQLSIANGVDTYTATTSTRNLVKTNIDSISYVQVFKDLYGEHEGVIVFFKDIPSVTNFYRYEMVRYVDTTTKKASEKIASPCLGGESVRVDEIGRSVYSNIGQNGTQIKIVVEPAYSHKNGTIGYVYMQSIDKNAYDFFDQLDKQKLAQLNPFVEPVFLRAGQFGSNAIGYFSAMIKSNPILFTYPE